MSGTLRKQIAFEQISKPPLLRRRGISQPFDFDTFQEQAVEFFGKLLGLPVQTAPCAPVAVRLCVSTHKAVPIPEREVESLHRRISLLIAKIKGQVGTIWQHLFYGLSIGGA